MLMKLSNRVRSVSLQRLQMATVEVHAPSSNSSSQKDCKELNSQGIKMSCANKKKWPIPTSHTSQNIAKELPSQNFSVPSCSLRSKVLQARDSQFNSSCLPGLEERLFLICLAEGIWLRRSDFLGFLGCSGCSSGTYSKISLPRSTYSWNVQIWPSRIPTVWAGDHVCLCKVAKYVQIAASHAQPALHACCPSGSWSLASQPDRVWKWSAFSLTFPDFSLRKPDLPKKKAKPAWQVRHRLEGQDRTFGSVENAASPENRTRSGRRAFGDRRILLALKTVCFLWFFGGDKPKLPVYYDFTN